MSAETPIEWTDRTWNPLVAYRKAADAKREFLPEGKRGWFCTKISPGCANCYAEGINVRLGTGHPYVRMHEKDVRFGLVNLDAPLKWRKPQKVFVNSMTDLFHELVPFDFVERIFAVMAQTPQHTYQILTKRPERMRQFMKQLQAAAEAHAPRTVDGHFTPADVLNLRHVARRVRTSDPFISLATGPAFPGRSWPLPNVWLGVSAEDQQRAEERVPELLKTPAAVRFISAEPLLGKIGLLGIWNRVLNEARAKQHLVGDAPPLSLAETSPSMGDALHWVIMGGESGAKARQCDLSDLRDLVQQCAVGMTACFVKQVGKRPVIGGNPTLRYVGRGKGGDMDEWPTWLRVREFPRRPE